MGQWIPRLRNNNWAVWQNDNGKYNDEQVKQMLLMDIRDELQKLNAVFACPNAIEIPNILREIRRNTTKRKYVRRKK